MCDDVLLARLVLATDTSQIALSILEYDVLVRLQRGGESVSISHFTENKTVFLEQTQQALASLSEKGLVRQGSETVSLSNEGRQLVAPLLDRANSRRNQFESWYLTQFSNWKETMSQETLAVADITDAEALEMLEKLLQRWEPAWIQAFIKRMRGSRKGSKPAESQAGSNLSLNTSLDRALAKFSLSTVNKLCFGAMQAESSQEELDGFADRILASVIRTVLKEASESLPGAVEDLRRARENIVIVLDSNVLLAAALPQRAAVHGQTWRIAEKIEVQRNEGAKIDVLVSTGVLGECEWKIQEMRDDIAYIRRASSAAAMEIIRRKPWSLLYDYLGDGGDDPLGFAESVFDAAQNFLDRLAVQYVDYRPGGPEEEVFAAIRKVEKDHRKRGTKTRILAKWNTIEAARIADSQGQVAWIWTYNHAMPDYEQAMLGASQFSMDGIAMTASLAPDILRNDVDLKEVKQAIDQYCAGIASEAQQRSRNAQRLETLLTLLEGLRGEGLPADRVAPAESAERIRRAFELTQQIGEEQGDAGILERARIARAVSALA